MKNLGKTLITLSLPVLSFFSANSNAQDFLPGNLNNYQTKADSIYYPEFIQRTKSGDLYIAKFYDIEKDGSPDVIEVYNIDEDKDSLVLRMRDNPVMYLFQLDKKTLMVVDPAEDGLQKEDFSNFKGEYYESKKSKIISL